MGRLAHTLGHRGTVLALLGFVWILTGIGTLITPPSPTYFLLAHGAWPRGFIWVITGCTALAYCRRRAGDDAPGFLALYLMAGYRVLAYMLGVIDWLATDGKSGDLRGIIGALSWLTILTLIIVISGWREHPDADLAGEAEL